MSHFSRIQTSMVNQEYLLKALTDLGYNFEIGEFSIRGFGSGQQKAEIKINIPFSYDIGLRRSGETYEIIADWFGVRGLKQKEFTDKLLQRYAYHASRAKLEEQGFTLVEELEEKGQIRLVLRRMA